MKLHEKYTFAKRDPQADDGYGNTLTDWVDQFTVRGHRHFLRGGEKVIAGRLEGRQPIIVTVRQSTATDEICPDWRITDARSGETYNVRAVERSQNRLYYEILCEAGVADG